MVRDTTILPRSISRIQAKSSPPAPWETHHPAQNAPETGTPRGGTAAYPDDVLT
jgi:hypothetical protein